MSLGPFPGPLGRAGRTAGPLGRLGPVTGCPCEVACRPLGPPAAFARGASKTVGPSGRKLGTGGRRLVWFVVHRPERAVVRPKGPAIPPARVVGPGRAIPPTHRPAQRANRSPNRAGHERNCWPVGPAHVVVGRSRPAGPGWGNGWPVGPANSCPWRFTHLGLPGGSWGLPAGGWCGAQPIPMGSLPIGAGVFRRMPSGADTSVRTPAGRVLMGVNGS
jgi:hypothetical protein